VQDLAQEHALEDAQSTERLRDGCNSEETMFNRGVPAYTGRKYSANN
jgi:hypothetical protein